MDLQLKNKKVLVTASSGGIGRAIASTLASEGAEVIVNGRSEKTVEAARAVIGGKTLPLVADLASAEGVAQATSEYPEVDILVNNLGIYWESPFEELSDEDWMKIFEVTRHYFPKMLKANWGRVIFIASESGIMVPQEMIHYGFSKSAQLSIAAGLAQLTKGTGVTVNSVLPGPTQTDSVVDFMRSLMEGSEGKTPDQLGQEFIQEHRSSSLLGRLIKPSEIASLVAYVASPLSAATNGAALKAEGGLVHSII